ncbi:MAG TPA: hypothetical protein VFA81_04480 [Burkholderiales bacterium]|nr:hypothetical protein [Burkholderiales bacterium]
MKTLRLFATCCALATPLAAHAGPADYVYTPGIEYGERELDFKIGSAKSSGEDRFSAASIGFGYGVTERWFTEVYGKYEREGGESTRFDAFEWENRFALTEQGRYPFDLGFVIELERPRDRAEGYEVRLGPLFQTDFDRWQLNFNLLFERHFRSEEESQTELGYQWQVRYLSSGNIDLGVQGFGEVGKWNHWASSSEQNHRVGPALFGKVNLGGRHILKYNAAVLFGLTSAAPDHTVRAQVEYEF